MAAVELACAAAEELAARGAKGVVLVDLNESVREVAKSINDDIGAEVAEGIVGDVTCDEFRKRCFDQATEQFGIPRICVPAAGITRDAIAVKVDKETGLANIYPRETFELVINVNLIAPVYWALETVARIAQERKRSGLGRWDPEEESQGAIVLIGSVSSQGKQGSDFLCSRQSRAGRCCIDDEQRSNVLWCAMRRDSSRFHRHADGSRHGRRCDPRTRLAVHTIKTLDPTQGNRRCDLLPGLQLCGQRRTLGRRRVASPGLKRNAACEED